MCIHVFQLDIPLNPIVYTWLLGQQKSLTAADLHFFDPTLASSYSQLQSLADKAKQIKADSSLVSFNQRYY